MSCLELKKLLPHRKVWKMLTKLPLKLMMRSKANKKHKNRSSYKTSKKLMLPSLSMQPKKFKKKPNSHTLIHRKNHHRCFQKRAPVFVDHLFVEPVTIVREHVIPSGGGAIKSSSLDTSSKRIEILDWKNSQPESCKEGETSGIDETREILDWKNSQPESCKEGETSGIDENRPESNEGVERSEVDDQSMISADDVWESMVLASPQMHEINERADEFIARFRAEMNHQEMLARRL